MQMTVLFAQTICNALKVGQNSYLDTFLFYKMWDDGGDEAFSVFIVH